MTLTEAAKKSRLMATIDTCARRILLWGGALTLVVGALRQLNPSFMLLCSAIQLVLALVLLILAIRSHPWARGYGALFVSAGSSIANIYLAAMMVSLAVLDRLIESYDAAPESLSQVSPGGYYYSMAASNMFLFAGVIWQVAFVIVLRTTVAIDFQKVMADSSRDVARSE